MYLEGGNMSSFAKLDLKYGVEFPINQAGDYGRLTGILYIPPLYDQIR